MKYLEDKQRMRGQLAFVGSRGWAFVRFTHLPLLPRSIFFYCLDDAIGSRPCPHELCVPVSAYGWPWDLRVRCRSRAACSAVACGSSFGLAKLPRRDRRLSPVPSRALCPSLSLRLAVGFARPLPLPRGMFCGRLRKQFRVSETAQARP
jgi:hypothetical protein